MSAPMRLAPSCRISSTARCFHSNSSSPRALVSSPFASRSFSLSSTQFTPTAFSSFRSFSFSSSTMSSTRKPEFRAVTNKTMNPAVLEAQYAVRGAIPLRAEELREQLEAGDGQLPFDKVVSCNIGNPQQLQQKPLTFLRQMAALTEYPDLIDSPHAKDLFPSDAIARAKDILEEIGSTGAYSHSMGVPGIRKRIAKFIEERDGFPSSAQKIYITAGASVGVSNMLQVLISSPEDGVLIPIPQYPLYTGALALNSARAVPYYLDEAKDWCLDMANLRESVSKSKSEGTKLKAMVVINPGNPTGSCLTAENMRDIIKLCYDEGLVLMADEVYQDNIYDNTKPFVSFKKAINEMGSPYAENLELVSFHSISKGQTGECGRRGGYFELTNFTAEAEEQIYKLASIQLCPSLGGQIGVDVLVCPPKKGDESYELWVKEREAIAETLHHRSQVLHKAFNELEGVKCNEAEGALYLFPTIELPQKAIQAAKEAKQAPDAFYCLKLLEATGICVVPGSGFGQKDGTYHFRTTFLAPGTEEFSGRFQKFHEDFMKEYRD